MKKILIGLFTIGLVSAATAQQDKHFSMFAESPVYLNPATAGFSPGQMQLFTNFRMQWLTVSDNPYRTISASVDWRMLDRGSFMGMGVNFYNDVAGDGQYMVNEVTVPINYAIELSKDNHLALGLQPAWYSRTLLSSNLTWDNQWTGTSFDQGISPNENLYGQNLNISKFDLSAGIHWYAHLNKQMRISLGLAGHHLTKQQIQFIDTNEDKLFRKLTVHGQMVIDKTNSNVSIRPAFFGFVQGPNMALTLGSNFKFLLRGASRVTGYFNEMSLSLGTYYRIGDAAIVNLIFDISGFSVGAAYDFNISGLTPATAGVGGFEFFLRYRLSFQGKGLGNPSIH
ncbi:MAG: PorP/SprF family type IX secretion system membrane protein [Crocinitomicaceae bacterium]|nr:PorP/SprF family type IX secretion system membrane protein [Crocinitomicaceae bacterium]